MPGSESVPTGKASVQMNTINVSNGRAESVVGSLAIAATALASGHVFSLSSH
jgi:hypothetical protein